MDPADPIQEALRLQGARLGQQAGEINNLHQGMEAIRADMRHFMEVITSQGTTAPVSPPPAAAAARDYTEPRLPPPERYEGDPRSCRSFLSTCSLVFELQPSSFPTERSKVAYVITLLSGRAREWATAVWDSNAPECQSFFQFSQAMRDTFDRSVSGPAATRQLFRIRQGQRSISDYAIEFRTLAASAGWGERELHGAYFNGLSEPLLDELNTCELPTSLNALIDLTLRIDARLTDRQAARHNREVVRPRDAPRTRNQNTFRPMDFPEPEPMQVGHSRLPFDERQRRRERHLCLYCGNPGHLIARCPVKGNARQ